MSEEHVGPYPLAGVGMPTWLIRFDETGRCLSSRTRQLLLAELAKGDATDVIFVSHGWNNDFAYATLLYERLLQRLDAIRAREGDGARRLLFVGVLWPSTLRPEVVGPVIAGDFAGDLATAEFLDSLPAPLQSHAGALVGNRRLDPLQAAELAALVAAVLPASDREGDEVGAPTAADVLAGAAALRQAAAPPAVDEDEQIGTVGGIATVTAAALPTFDALDILRLFTVYQMKDRAGRVGAAGVSSLLRDMLGRSVLRVHCVGHSYGAKVMLSAVCAGAAPLPRPVRSLLLLQPAVSHLCFARYVPGRDGPGGYRRALDPARVERPVVATFSAHDLALHKTFHLALRRATDLGEAAPAAGATSAGTPPSRYAALGGYGPRGADEMLIDPVPDDGAAYPAFGAARVVGLDGTLGKRIGGHGDVASPVTAWALYQQLIGE